MEIRKQILGVIIGIFITISFITPVYSYVNSNDDLCEIEVYDLIEILHKVKKGEYFKSNAGYYRLKQ